MSECLPKAKTDVIEVHVPVILVSFYPQLIAL